MIIGLDLDNTIAKYSEGLANSIAAQLGVTDLEAHALAYGEPVDYAMSNWPNFPDAFHDFHTQGVELGLYRDLEIIADASEYLWKLSDEGHHIRIITSRFVKNGQNSKVVRDTGIWLDDNNVPYKDIMFTNLKADVHANLYLDDSPHNIDVLNSRGKNVLIYDAPYNRDIAGLRTDNWKDAYEKIAKFAADNNL